VGDKVERLATASIAFEQGRVYFPAHASWLPDLERELLGFPATKHDDQVDSISQYLNWALTEGRYVVGYARAIGMY
jgi:predicted phage terminase large subunit-like protein